jgi:hypothetical protein
MLLALLTKVVDEDTELEGHIPASRIVEVEAGERRAEVFQKRDEFSSGNKGRKVSSMPKVRPAPEQAVCIITFISLVVTRGFTSTAKSCPFSVNSHR